MTSSEIRQQFLDFFKSKGHLIVPSAPIVVKNDPTLMFTNAGMNQFKDMFLGNKNPIDKRVADTQKCLRVSGKHNDLEEVGVDTYHHTMFEMLGNWSFGDYFKKEAIEWSWELLTKVYKIDANRLYVTIFEGDAKENLAKDEEAYNWWLAAGVPAERILLGNKKDNFWEMGDTGPCGPCTEIHYDGRTEEERKTIPGASLVNNDDPQVIEIWNNVFMEFNRKADGSLEKLPAQHVDTGMGFERLVRVMQGKQSNYDTDVFSGTIAAIEKIVGMKYAADDTKASVAFRVLADHIRTISFAIADGQLPSSNGAGYVIRRILRRAVRYYYSYLNYKQPLLYQLVPVIAKQFENVFPELSQQNDFVANVILEEERGFLRTLESGLKKIEDLPKLFYIEQANEGFGGLYDLEDDIEVKNIKNRFVNDMLRKKEPILIQGKTCFELYDTYGFPFDLTRLIASENGWSVDEEGFNIEMAQQKARSRKAAATETGDWQVFKDGAVKFVGYEKSETESSVLKYRKVKQKDKELYQIVLDVTPFYAESGGQVGDTGILNFDGELIKVIDTKKENDLIVHFTEEIPQDLSGKVLAKIDESRRRKITRHHSVTHLMQAALREVLGTHVAQKGSLNNDDYLRFDFSHFAKVTDEEIAQIEKIVNRKIRQNIPVVIKEMPKEEAMKLGAMALFGEKYGDVVRVVVMDKNFSIELCGGTHVMRTGELSIFKIISEGAVAAGVRRIEALAGCRAEAYLMNQVKQLNDIKAEFKNPKDIFAAIKNVQEEKAQLQKQIEKLEAKQLVVLRQELLQKKQIINNTTLIAETIEVSSADALKKLCHEFKTEIEGNYLVCLAANIGGKVSVAVAVNDNSSLDAGKIIKEHIAPLIKGGGGGNKTLASAGGVDLNGIAKVMEKMKAIAL
ncbi:MAG: hypothetical protein RJA07_603 [Bacteroidota bacterium]|jgi:alanyl-tRNA synthetase